MRQALPLALAALLLGGCASHKPEDFNGTWINQDAITAAVKGSSLRQALNEHGPVFEWKLDVASQQASYSNGFEAADGQLSANDKQWQANFEGGQTEQLSLDGDELLTVDQSGAKQTFVRAKAPATANAPLGSSFEKALYQAYLGGDWKITEGQGKGASVRFSDTGNVTGQPGRTASPCAWRVIVRPWVAAMTACGWSATSAVHRSSSSAMATSWRFSRQ